VPARGGDLPLGLSDTGWVAHTHSHTHPHQEHRQRALGIALVANCAFLCVEVAGGFAFNSLALIADAAHMLTDVAALVIALIAQRLMERPATTRHTYGLQRAEVIGAQANALLLLGVTIWVVVEAIRRLGEPQAVSGRGLILVAAAGLIVNVASAIVIARRAGESLNMRGAFLHMALDAAGSAGALVAGVGVVVADATWLDPFASILIAALVVWSSLTLLRRTTRVLMEGAPRGIDPDEVERFLSDDPAVEGIHHVHVWNLASEVPALSAHVVINGEISLHEAQLEGNRLRAKVLERFGIEHTTFELECHACEPDATSSP
jgi:cobalt-zinc-cadmium efflux system protein